MSLISLFLLFISTAALAIPALHLIRPGSSFSQISSLDTCSTFKARRDSVQCNPALFPYARGRGINISLAAITDGDSVETGKKLVFTSVKEEFLRELFQKQSYSGWDGSSLISFRTPYFYLQFSPIASTVDVFVYNPAFPEVSMALVKTKSLGATAGWEVFQRGEQRLSIGTQIFYQERKEFIGSFPLTSLTGNNVNDLIDFKTKSMIGADVGLFYQTAYRWVPKASVQIKNMNSNFYLKNSDVVSDKKLIPILVYETYAKAALGQDFSFTYGNLGIEISAPFKGYFESYYSDYVTLGSNYIYGGFEIMGGLAKYQKNIGFKFSAKSLSVGVFYAQTKALGAFMNKWQDAAGVQLEFSL